MGEFAIEKDGRRVSRSEWRGRLPRLIVAYIILKDHRRRRGVRTADLNAAFWPDAPDEEAARNRRNVAVHHARSVLTLPGRRCLLTCRDDRYHLTWDDPALVIDIEKFHASAARGDRAFGRDDRGQALSEYRDACALFESGVAGNLPELRTHGEEALLQSCYRRCTERLLTLAWEQAGPTVVRDLALAALERDPLDHIAADWLDKSLTSLGDRFLARRTKRQFLVAFREAVGESPPPVQMAESLDDL